MNGEIPNKTNNKKAEKLEPTLKNVDFDSIWQRRQRRQTHLLIIYLWVVLMISLAWLVGYCNLSFSWLLAIFIVTLSVWRTKVFRITEEHLMHEQLTVHRRRALRGSETVEWLNFIVNRWCLFSSTGLCDVIKRRVDPILKKFKPALLEDVSIRSLTFGDQAPNVHHIQVFETSDGLPGGRKQASWLNVGKPPKELGKLDRYHIVFDMEAGLHCEQFKMVLATKVAGMASGPDILVENLKVEGRLHASVTFSTDVPFPHVSRLVVSFDEKPSIWFSVKVLRSLQLMEIPLLKSWIHNLVLDVVCLSFVDPYKFEIDLANLGPSAGPVMKPLAPPATGVLSLLISADGYQTDDTAQTYSADDVTFCTLQLGETVIHTPETKLGQPWSHSCSLLVTDLENQKLTLDVETKQMLSSISVATYELVLANYTLTQGQIIDAVLDKEQTSLKTPLNLHMQYTELPPVALTQSPPVQTVDSTQRNTVCGVMYICVHGGYDLIAMDDNGFSDPYCVIFANRKKIHTSHYVRQSLSPHWEVRTEIIVEDFSKTSLQFLVYDWDGFHANEDDFLGAAHFTLSGEEPYVVHKPLDLSYNILNVGQVSDVNLGSIVVSVLFRPVPAVNYFKAEHVLAASAAARQQTTLGGDLEEQNNTASKSSTHTDVFKLLSQGLGILELTIMCARQLVAMDSNGFSDPYVEVKIGSQKKFVTTVKKKTLNPVWDESVTTQLPDDGEVLELSVWDKDPLMMKDFIGSVEFNADDLKRISSIGEPGWYLLQKTKSGQIKLGIKVLTQDMKDCLEELSVFANKPSVTSSEPTPDDVFDQNDNITAEVAEKAERGTELYGTLPKNRKKKNSTGSSFSLLKRSQSDAQVNKTDRFRFFRFKSVDKENTPSHHTSIDDVTRRNSSESDALKVQSTLDLRSHGNARLSSKEDDTPPADSSSSNVEKFFSVKGTISRYRINHHNSSTTLKGNVYCKLRVDSRTELQRKQKFSAGRVIGKTPTVKIEEGEHPLEFEFEIDRGGGIRSDSLFIFDMKTTSKNSHLATRGYTLKNMFQDTDTFEHWLPMENSIQFLVQLSRDPTQSSSRPPRNPLNRLSQSFRRARASSAPPEKRRSAPLESVLTMPPQSPVEPPPPPPSSRHTAVDSDNFLTTSGAGNEPAPSLNNNQHKPADHDYSTLTLGSSVNSDLDPVSPRSAETSVSEMAFSTDLNVGRLELDLDANVKDLQDDDDGNVTDQVNGHYETDIDDCEPTFIRKRRLSITTDV